MRPTLLALALAILCSPAFAQRSRAQTQGPHAQPASPAPAPAPAPAPQPAANPPNEPQRTTATFGDWTLRCVRPERAAPACEVTQTLVERSQPFAQIALGSPGRGEGLRLTILVPVNVTVTAEPRLVGTENQPAGPLALAWRRCVPVGCLADAAINDDLVRLLRNRTENARIVFQDAAGRETSLPFGPRGLGQAMDALAKERTASD